MISGYITNNVITTSGNGVGGLSNTLVFGAPSETQVKVNPVNSVVSRYRK